jgi:NitT/TauT family transport system ATP-binding protein
MDLIVEGVTHGYGQLPVLAEVALCVPTGEVVALVGPSGCGKSTLLGIAGGLIRPDQGKVRTEGAPPVGCLNPITLVFQDFALLPWRSVAANVAFALEHHPLTAAERKERVADVLQRTGLSDFADAFPRQLSGGMRQRVGLARALVVEPALLLMDEPFSALDAQTRDLLIDDFLALWRRTRVGALYVTHNLDEAVRLADRVVVLSRRPGRVRATLPIELDREQRALPEAAPALARLHAQLWDLIREEARVADRELIHG